eukprot:scaffold691964_cov138-Attheya_sp.AAC.1
MKTSFLSCLALSGLMLSLAEPEQDRSLAIKSCSSFSFQLTSDDTNCDVTKEDLNEVTHLIQDEFKKFDTKIDGGVVLESMELLNDDPNTRRLGRRLGFRCSRCWSTRYNLNSDRLRHLKVKAGGLRHLKADRQRQLADAVAQVFSDPEFQSTMNTDVFESPKLCATGIEFN